MSDVYGLRADGSYGVLPRNDFTAAVGGTPMSFGSPPADPAPAPAPAPAAPAPAPAATDPASTLSNADKLRNTLFSEFPWLARLGVPMSWFAEQAAQVTSNDEMLSTLRQLPQYKSLFPSIMRTDGTLRTSEANYLQTNDQYRQLMKQYGRADYEYDNPADFTSLWENEVDPNEFKQRLTTWDTLDKGTDDVKNAFYVYAGMKLTTDDLYNAVVNPEASNQLQDEYNNRVATQPLDYQTWITRATEVGLSQVAKTLTNLQSNGSVTGVAVSQVLQTDPKFAQQMMDALYHGGDGAAATRYLNLDELTNAFQYAMIGGAASQNGLALPDKPTIQAIRQAGIDRTQALQGYADYAKNQNLYNAAVQRATGQGFTQADFERATFLQQGGAQQQLQEGLGLEKAMGKSGGGFGFSTGSGQLQQQGFNTRS